jgi:hypothetical protein
MVARVIYLWANEFVDYGVSSQPKRLKGTEHIMHENDVRGYITGDFLPDHFDEDKFDSEW